MPRVRANPAATPFSKSPIKIPLNDDREEKAKRLQSRQAFHEMQMNSLKAAASPARKRKSLGGDNANGDAPGTPQNGNAGSQDDGFNVAGNAVTPMKRVPILANFEEWMKMATDNKINAANSWNFALIDYFHDMSLLKEGDGVNFQKASCTLDGCVKIYTSRVDSVATETGKLLSGLADSGSKKNRDRDGGDGEGEGDDGEEGDDDEGGSKRRTKKTRSAEATLATSFAQLQLKKMELEFSVDPLFKKASADFDEGGAKGLLLNHLSIDNTGRIVFDSSDDAQDEALEESRRDSMLRSEAEAEDQDQDSQDKTREMEGEEHNTEASAQPVHIDIATLGARFFPQLSKLDYQDICPSLKTFELGDGSASLDLPFLKAPEDWRKDKGEDDEAQDDARSGIVLDDDNGDAFDDDGALRAFDLPPDTAFGEGGEAWAKEAHIEPQMRPHDSGAADGDAELGVDGGEVGGFEPHSNQYGVTLQVRGDDHENILSYFDQAMQKNWAGPEHWKIKRVKDAAKPAAAPSKRKEKEPFEIDFASPMSQDLANLLYTPAASNATISLPRNQWKSKTRNLLPDDKHFSSRDLLRLFLKPKARLGARNPTQPQSRRRPDALPEGEVDEAYWAQNQGPTEQRPAEDQGPHGDYDANFFQDDGLGVPGAAVDDDDEDFADAQEMLPPLVDGPDGANGAALPSSSQEGAFGSQLVTQSRRLRPEYVQYARVAKKIDMRRLKEEMWRGIGFGPSPDAPAPASHDTTTPDDTAPPTPAKTDADAVLKFTDVVNNLQSVYPKQQMADISTSFCFICLLHLANEKGLVIENEPGWQELSIRRDASAEIIGEGD